MRKRISLKTRRPGLTIAEFRTHYEERHVPLGLSHIDHFRWRRYVRNYVVDRFGARVAFDGYTEFWDDEDGDDALNAFLASPDFERLDRDDRRFLSVDRRFSAVVAEEVLVESAGYDLAALKYAFLWRDGDPRAVGAFAARLVAALGDQLVEATLDRSMEQTLSNAPFTCLLSLRVTPETRLLENGRAVPGEGTALIRLDPVETPPSLLYRGRETRANSPQPGGRKYAASES